MATRTLKPMREFKVVVRTTTGIRSFIILAADGTQAAKRLQKKGYQVIQVYVN